VNSQFAEKLRCPARACGGARLTLEATTIETIAYPSGPLDEVREGQLHCPACDRRYPIHEFVPSFEALFPAELQEEADFWGRWYGFLWDKGYLGLFDLRAPMAPFVTEGVITLDPTPWEQKEQGGTHVLLATHPLIREADWLLDVGCGTGWSSLYLARQGHRVVGFDPAGANMILAKRYAIEQGVYIEYLAAGLGFLDFQPDSFDAVIALHSIHHVPNLRHEMGVLRGWLREGGGIGVDEHVRNDPTLFALYQQMFAWARNEVFPQVRSLGEADLTGLPTAGHSSLEGAGSDDVIDSFLDHFALETFSSRYISLDLLSFIYYLSRDEDREGMNYAASIIDRLYRFMQAAFPDSAEYVTLVGCKTTPVTQPHPDLVDAARRLSAGPLPALAEAQGDRATIHALVELNTLRDRLVEMEPHIAAKDAYIARLEATVAAKNRHIGHLERRVAGQQRVLNRLPVRVLSRLLRRG
jgi:SAM-dependent methyltransferase